MLLALQGSAPFGGDGMGTEERRRAALMGPAGLDGACRPNTWPKFFETFCEILSNAEFQNSNMLWFKNKYFYAKMK